MKNKCKIDDFFINIQRMPEVIAISETKLNSFSTSNVNIPNYKLLRNDSNTCAGGVGLYIKNTIKLRVRDDLLLNLQHCENLWIEIESKFSSFIFVVTYRHPEQKIPLFHEKLCENLSKLENKKLNYFVVGDLNINTLAKNRQTENYMINLNSFGCKLLIDLPTRFANNCKFSSLDHIYNSSDGRVVRSVCLLSCRLEFDSESGQTNDLKIGIHSFPA